MHRPSLDPAPARDRRPPIAATALASGTTAALLAIALGVSPVSAQSHGTWSQVGIAGSPSQTPVSSASALYDPSHHRKVLVCGDVCNAFCFSSAVSVLDLSTHVWSLAAPAGPTPPNRFIPNIAYDSRRQRIVMFGGSYTSDTQVWELRFGAGSAMTWAVIPIVDPPPSVRYQALTAYDSLGDRLLLYGGSGSSPSELLAVNFADLTWSSIPTTGTPPASSGSPRGVFDPAGDRFVMVLGGQTWELSSLTTNPTWTRFAIPEPAPSGPAILDPVKNWMMVFETSTRVWRLDLAAPLTGGWGLLTIDGPTPSGYDGPVFDPVGYRIVGERSKNVRFGIPHETWALSLHPAFPTSVPAGPGSFRLEAPRPNPTPGDLVCAFTLPSAERARLEVFDLAGRRVVGREVGSLGPGAHRVDLAAGVRLPPGVYTVALAQGGRRATARVVVTR